MSLAGYQIKTVKLWNLSENTYIKTLHGHTGSVLCLVLLKTGDLASGSKDNTIKIWNRESGECIKTLHGHKKWVYALESTDIFNLISCSRY